MVSICLTSKSYEESETFADMLRIYPNNIFRNWRDELGIRNIESKNNHAEGAADILDDAAVGDAWNLCW